MVASSFMKLAAARLLLRLLAPLPLAFNRRLARVMAVIPVGGRRSRVDANLALAFPDESLAQRRRLATGNRIEMMSTALECAPLWHRPREWIEAHFLEPDGLDAMTRALQAGKGVLLVGGHLGHWEATILYGTLNLPIAYLYKPPDDPELDSLLTANRSRFGGEFIRTGSSGMRRALVRLRSGQAVGLLFDQLPRGGDHVEAPFFGHPVPTMTLAWRLARRTGCEVVVGHCMRVPGQGWRPVVRAVPGLADETDPVAAARQLNQALEDQIRTAPAQYLWRYRRFDRITSPGRGGESRPR